jgi:hypothetical protein
MSALIMCCEIEGCQLRPVSCAAESALECARSVYSGEVDLMQTVDAWSLRIGVHADGDCDHGQERM